MVPEYPDDPVKQQAFTLFVVRGYPLRDICDMVARPLSVLEEWIADDSWCDRRNRLLMASREAAAAQIGMRVSQDAGSLVSRYLTLQEKLLTELEKALDTDEPLTPRAVSTIAKASSSVYGVYEGLLASAGVARRTGNAASPGEDPGEPASTLVQVNILGSLGRATEDIHVDTKVRDNLAEGDK